MKSKHIYSNHRLHCYVSLALLVIFMLVVLVSWIVTSISYDVKMRSLISGEGIRWLCGNFVNNMLSPFLVWIILAGMVVDMMDKSGLPRAILRFRRISVYEKMALWPVFIEILLAFSAITYFAFIPHAVLLNSVGKLFPSSFSSFAIPFLEGVAILVSCTYGRIVGSFKGIYDMFKAGEEGIVGVSPYIIVYMLLCEVIHSVNWIFDI